MVRAGRLRLQWGVMAAGFALAGALSAQDTTPNSLAALQDNAAKRTAEWSALAANLEARLTRLLPCDPRVRSSIEEVGRAADARAVALTSYGSMLSIKSKTQIDAIRELLMQEEGRAGDWAKDNSDAHTQAALPAAQSAALGLSLRQIPSLATAQKSLEGIGLLYRTLEAQTQERQTSMSKLVIDLGDLLKAAGARQAALEGQLKAVSTEGQRWSGYYAARLARSQIECSLINPASAPAPAPAVPRPAPPVKKP